MNGVPVPVVSPLLGHSNVSMSLRYAHLDDDALRNATEKTAGRIAKAMGHRSIKGLST